MATMTLGMALLLALSGLLPALAPAQSALAADTSGPRRGTWGAEAVVSSRGIGASLLRSSARRPWAATIGTSGAGECGRPASSASGAPRTSSVRTRVSAR